MVCVAFEVPPDDDATEDDAETEGDDDAEDAAMEAGHAGEGTCTECAAWSPDLEEEDSGTECAACWSPDGACPVAVASDLSITLLVAALPHKPISAHSAMLPSEARIAQAAAIIHADAVGRAHRV